MSYSSKNEYLKRYVEALPQVVSADEVNVEDSIIRYISLEIEKVGAVIARQLTVEDGPELYDFYFQGLSERARRLFIPYPLFHTPPSSAEELSQRIANWRKEDDWSAIIIEKDGGINGLGILKRFRTEQVTSGIAIRDDLLEMGLGYCLQMIIVGQARLLDLEKFHVKVISDNMASVRLHEKCGFKKTGIVPWNGYEDLRNYLNESDNSGKSKATERNIIEMVIELNDEERD